MRRVTRARKDEDEQKSKEDEQIEANPGDEMSRGHEKRIARSKRKSSEMKKSEELSRYCNGEQKIIRFLLENPELARLQSWRAWRSVVFVAARRAICRL